MKPLYFLCFILLFISSCSYVNAPNAPVKRAPVEYGTMPQSMKQAAAQPTPAQLANAKYKIGLLVPLTGKSAKIGKDLSNAAQMAIFEGGNADYQVIPFDTGDSSEGAAGAAQKAVDAGVNVILGPVFSDKVKGVADIAKQAGIKVISFSNNTAVAGGNVYILGLITDQQVRRVIDYADGRGIKGYSAILPANMLGKQVEETVNNDVKSAGGEVRKIATYAGSDYSAPAKEIADEYAAKSIVADRKSESLLILEGNKAGKIASALKANELGSLRLLGTGLWDNNETISNPALDGSWFASVPRADLDAFNSRFQSNFGYSANDIASLSYDGVMLVMETAPSNFSDGEFHRGYGFRGVNGIYKFDSKNVNKRGYAVYEIQNRGSNQVDNAPNSF